MTTAEFVNSTTENREDVHNGDNARQTPLLDERETNDLRIRWQQVQGGFVDDPPSQRHASRRTGGGFDQTPGGNLRHGKIEPGSHVVAWRGRVYRRSAPSTSALQILL